MCILSPDTTKSIKMNVRTFFIVLSKIDCLTVCIEHIMRWMEATNDYVIDTTIVESMFNRFAAGAIVI